MRARTAAQLAVAATIALAAGPLVAQARRDGPREIAILLPISGDHEHIGQAILEAIELALDQASGVSWSVHDTRGDAERAARLVEQLADNPAIAAVVGPIGAAESRAAAEVASRRGLPLLALTSEPGVEGGYAFRMRVAPQEQARQIARAAMTSLEMRRFAVLFPDDGVGRAATAAFVDEVLGGGGRITALEAYDPEETNLGDPVGLLVGRRQRQVRGRAFDSPPRVSDRHRSDVSRVDFEAVFIPDEADRVALALPFLAFVDAEPGRRVQLLGLSSWGERGLQISGELAAGALFPRIFDEAMDGTDVSRFTGAFREAYERSPSEAEAQAYDAARLLLAVMSGAPQSRTALREALLAEPPFRGLGSDLWIERSGAVGRTLPIFSAGASGWVGPYDLLH